MKHFTTALATGVCLIAIATPAHAQTRAYAVPAGSLKAALDSYAAQSGRQIIYRSDDIEGARSRGYRGRASDQAVLEAILAHSGFTARQDSSGAIAVVRVGNGQSQSSTGESAKSNDAGATPEILVTGQRGWSLNTDIKRTRDDAQPYVVFDREQIQRSGSRTLEDFFRDYVPANVGGAIGETRSESSQNGTINLRGLGPDETLILVDGRRIAPRKSGGIGTIGQPRITGIPLGAIERIEVLASSASGIYGSSATGGVINIVLKRDYSGLEVTAGYGGTYDGGAGTRRVDLTAGTNLFGGSTNVMVTGSWQKSNPLLAGQRDWYSDYRERLFGNATSAASGQPLGATTNIRSSNGAILTLKPQYGGGSLGSAITSVPYGYRGIAQDGIAGLVSNAGHYNFDLAPTVQDAGSGNKGRLGSFINQTENFSGNFTVRQEITGWLKAFAEIEGSRDKGLIRSSVIPSQFTIAASAPNNPFQQSIVVLVPQVGFDSALTYKADSVRATGGVIASLPYGWQASADYSWNKTWTSYTRPTAVSQALLAGISNGSVDVLRDLALSPLTYDRTEFGAFSTGAPIKTTTASLRLAGPLPIRLPGGKITVTVQAQRAVTSQGASVSYSTTTSAFSASALGNYSPPRSITADSAYFEGRIPIFGPSNHVPFINELEFQVAGRYERYSVFGATTVVTCFTETRPLIAADFDRPCPPQGQAIDFGTSSRSSFNPTYSLKWKPVPDLMLRASYATGYRPPDADQLIRQPLSSGLIGGIFDPERGNEPIGTTSAGIPGYYYISRYGGGNPNVKPEISRSYTAGVVLTPRGIPNLRLSADWTRIIKRDNYFNPAGILLVGTPTPQTQATFEDFLNAYPDRFVRSTDPATFGSYSVGPITTIDGSMSNLAGSWVGAIDFAADYSTKFAGGALEFSLNATWLYDLTVQTTANSPRTQYAGVVGGAFFNGLDYGGPSWKGNASIRYSNEIWSIGVRGNYFDAYWLNSDHTVVAQRNSATVPAQAYFDVFGSYRILKNTEINAGVRNVFNKAPPFDGVNGLYSPFGDPRGGTYYLTISQKF